MINLEALRRDLPAFDTRLLASEWADALQVFNALREVDVFRAMSIGTRRMLFQMVRAMGAKHVLDIGTYTGTSALTFSLAVDWDGRVVTVDVVDANAEDGFWKVDGRPHSPRQLMDKAGVAVEFVTQDANEYLKATEDRFDLICIDSAKSEDDTYAQLPLAVARLKPGGLIFMDDVFADGRPMPSGYYEAAHWNVLQRYQAEGLIRAIPVTRTLEGARIACAWVLRA